jgi:hypothetical protein
MWLARTGLVLEFLAFWFAAPELLGEQRLRLLEGKLETFLERNLRSSLSLLARYYERKRGPRRRYSRVDAAELEAWKDGDIEAQGGIEGMASQDKRTRKGRLVIGGISVIGTLFLFAASFASLKNAIEYRETRCLATLMGCGLLPTAVLGAAACASILLPDLLRTLADDRYIRRRSLLAGALLFVLGIILQLFAPAFWLNRVGLLLDLTATFLVGPEVLGRERLSTLLLRRTLQVGVGLFILSTFLQLLGQRGVPSLVGAGLEFVAFWFAVPEVFGQSWLDHLKRRNLLIVGAVIFALGILLQFIGSF